MPSRRRRKCRQPLASLAVDQFGGLGQFRFDFRDTLDEFFFATFLVVTPNFQQRTFIAFVGVFGAVEKCKEFEVLVLGDRIVLVSVALGARHRRTHPNRHCRVDPVDDCDVPKLFVVGPAFIVGQGVFDENAVAISCCSVGSVNRSPAICFDGELIKRHVVVDRADYIVSKGPNGPRGIVGVAR